MLLENKGNNSEEKSIGIPEGGTSFTPVRVSNISAEIFSSLSEKKDRGLYLPVGN